jgi:DNA polymerase-3 subunit alpha
VDRFGEDLQAFGAVPLAELTARRTGEDDAAGAGAAAGTPSVDVSVGGIVAQLRPLKTRKGDPMCVCTLEDAQGSIEVVVFPEAFRQHGHLVESGRMLLVTGRLERDDDSARLLASEIQPLEQVRERLVRAVAIRVSMPPHDRGTFERLWDVFAHHKGDRRVAFDIDLQEADRHLRVTVDVNAQIRVRPSEHLVSEVERICGEGSVRLR